VLDILGLSVGDGGGLLQVVNVFLLFVIFV
jgi:hypothetical protein